MNLFGGEMVANPLMWNMADFAIWAGQTTLAVTGLCLFVLLIRRPFARLFGAKAAYMLWALPVLRLLIPAIPVPEMSKAEPLAATPVAEYIYAVQGSTGFDRVAAPPGMDWSIFIAPFIVIWALIVCVLAIKTIGTHLAYVARLRHEGEVPSQKVFAEAESIAVQIGLKHTPEIVHHGQTGPLVCGLLKPIIAVPDDFENAHDSAARKTVLMHEMTHIKRGDLWAAALGQGLKTLFWFNPIFYWAYPSFRCDQEAACDVDTIAKLKGDTRSYENKSYGRVLVDFATQLTPTQTHSTKRSIMTEPVLGLSLTHPLKERLLRMTYSQSPRRKTAGKLLAGTSLIAGLLLTTPLVTIAGPDDTLAGSADAQVKVQKKNVQKSVIRIREDNNGSVEDLKLTVTNEDGVVTVTETDEFGNTRVLSENEIGGYDADKMNSGAYMIKREDGQWVMSEFDHGGDNVWVSAPDAPHAPGMKKHRIIVMDGDAELPEGFEIEEEIIMGDMPEGTMMKKRVIVIDDEDMDFDFDMEAPHPPMPPLVGAMAEIEAAEAILAEAESDPDLTPKARRSIEKARKEVAAAKKEVEKARAEAKKARGQ